MNVVLAVVDSLQRKVFDRYFDIAFGVKYTDARSLYCATPSSMYTLLVGKEWHAPGSDLFEQALRRGYTVAAYTHDQLFVVDGYNYTHWNRPGGAPALGGWADDLQTLPTLPEPYFLFLHFWSTHLPYGVEVFDDYPDFFGKYGSGKELIRRVHRGELTVEELQLAYEARAATVLQRLLSWAAGANNVLFIVTADHAEGLREEYLFDLHAFFHGADGGGRSHLRKVPLWINWDFRPLELVHAPVDHYLVYEGIRKALNNEALP